VKEGSPVRLNLYGNDRDRQEAGFCVAAVGDRLGAAGLQGAHEERNTRSEPCGCKGPSSGATLARSGP
jgi:hypothetical protein